MNELTVFSNEEFGSVRTLTIDNEPWFVGKDVAAILGYSNTRDALVRHVDEEDKNTVVIRDGIQGNPNTVVINESGLYSLILSSKLPSAKRFKRWVTSEVLPSIRRHGLYAVDEVLENPDILINALQALKSERERNRNLEQTVGIQRLQIAEMQPKASYYDVVLNCKDLVPISVIAKDYGWSARQMNQYLHKHGIQYKQGKIWLLYQEHAEMGYTSTKTHSHLGGDGSIHTSVHTYWTQKGRLFIYDRLKADGVLPLMEQKDAA